MIEALKGDQIHRPEARRRREGRGRRGGECALLCPLEHTSVALLCPLEHTSVALSQTVEIRIKWEMVPSNNYREQPGVLHPRN
jgi:hypothetical protein